ncbi:hypothetical protein HY212_01040 [Candidatus Pacearchaeota archaeon]|nr:hypothetical protein [Candidatus Pacearchaeota archaeon]
MENADFVETYHLSEVREKLSRDSIADTSDLGRVLDTAMSLRTRVGNLEVGKNDGLYEIRFSTDSYLERSYESFVLAPFESYRPIKKLVRVGLLRKVFKKIGNPFISLAYSFENGRPAVIIQYIQSTNRMDQSIYDSLKSELGVNPHEFLLAHFLSRLSPVLDARPETNVLVSDSYTSKSVYPRLRDRFFDGMYHLNPEKERVRQILGEDNAWIKSRK